MAAADAYRELIDLATGAAVAKGDALVELGNAAVRLQPLVEADGRCDHLLDAARTSIATGDVKQLALDLAEIAREAPRELDIAAPNPEAAIRVTLRWVGPPDDADAVAAHFDADAVSWQAPSPFLPASRFETVLRFGDTVKRPHLDGAVGAALRQLPALLYTTEGAERPEHWWLGGRLELLADLPALGGSRAVALSGAVASRLGAWGSTLSLDIHD